MNKYILNELNCNPISFEGTLGYNGMKGAVGNQGTMGNKGITGPTGSSEYQYVFAMNRITEYNLESGGGPGAQILLPFGGSTGAVEIVNNGFVMDVVNSKITYIGNKPKYFYVQTSFTFDFTPLPTVSFNIGIEVRKNNQPISQLNILSLTSSSSFIRSDIQDFNIILMNPNDYLSWYYVYSTTSGTYILSSYTTTGLEGSKTKPIQIFISEVSVK
jgi:hypothetical protein